MDVKPAGIIGLDREISLMIKALEKGIPVILEGEAGTGKTEMAKAVASHLGRELFRVDGDQELTSMKMQGWFDPPLVISQGYCWDSFVPGPLSEAMQQGGVFFFNEVNRAPMEAINGILAAIDEKAVHIPRLGVIKAEAGFISIFTCNPLDRVGTNPLPEAFFDRCMWIHVDHLPLEQAMQIVQLRTGESSEKLVRTVCQIVEGSRHHPDATSGGSIRAAIFMTKIAQAYVQSGEDPLSREALITMTKSALMKKVKMRYDSDLTEESLLEELVDTVLGNPVEKKTAKRPNSY